MEKEREFVERGKFEIVLERKIMRVVRNII